MAKIIELKNVSKRYRSVVAMNGMNLEVPEGCVFALLGENGAGKTTTIRTLLGLEKQDSGSASVLGMDPIRHSVSIRRRIGYVPDAPKLYDWMKVSEIGWFAGGFYPEGYMQEFSRLCDEFGLSNDVKIKTLSKGGKAKVALALAMAHKPPLLILDEPTSGLDTMVRRKFLESMVDVASENRTVFLCSHQIPEVERVADYVAIMNQGKVCVSERLDVLKEEMEQWVITLENPNISLPSNQSFVLLHEGHGKLRQQLTVRKPHPDALWKLRESPGIVEVNVHTPSLEEIFIAYMSSAEQSREMTQIATNPVVEKKS